MDSGITNYGTLKSGLDDWMFYCEGDQCLKLFSILALNIYYENNGTSFHYT